MTEDIKKITAAAHQALEGFLIPLIKHTYTTTEYNRLLRMFYGYYKPLEDRLDLFQLAEVVPDYGQRRKAHLLLDDLGVLGQETGDIPLCSALPAIRSQEEASGALYVLEGSTLGGTIIRKILQRNLQRTGQEGFLFFTGYGEHTHERWLTFKAALDGRYRQSSQLEQITSAATQTFQTLKNWAQYCYNQEPVKDTL